MNPDFLTTCNATGNNALIFATYSPKTASKRIAILNEIINIYVSNDKLDCRGKSNHYNALMLASSHGHYECVEFLVSYYAEAGLLHEKNKVGRNALEEARLKERENVISLLQKYYE